jgi:prevent-host-death family protein
MKTVSVKEAKDRLTQLLRAAESGETVVITRNGVPVADIVPHKRRGGVDLEAGYAYLKSIGVEKAVLFVADDFDAPLPEDFLIAPMK